MRGEERGETKGKYRREGREERGREEKGGIEEGGKKGECGREKREEGDYHMLGKRFLR